jgi:hypothetical protein
MVLLLSSFWILERDLMGMGRDWIIIEDIRQKIGFKFLMSFSIETRILT